MKKLFFLLLLTAVAFSLVSCKSMIPSRFEKFVDKIEKNGSTFTEEQWKETSAKFEKLMDEYAEAYDKLSEEERDRVDRAIGRYRAVVLKSKVNSVVEDFQKTVSDISDRIAGIGKRFASFIKSLGLGLENEK